MQQVASTKKFLLIAVLVIVAFYGGQYFAEQGTQAVSSPGDSAPPAASSGEVAIQPLSQMKLERLTHNQGKPSLLFIYASWCPYCQRQFPVIHELQEAYGDDLQLIVTSVDRNRDDLADFLADKPQPLEFTPYHVSATEAAGFRTWMDQKNAEYGGSIPHSVLLNDKGELVSVFSGLTQANAFKAQINLLEDMQAAASR